MITTNFSLNKIFRILFFFIFSFTILGNIHSTNLLNTKQIEQHQSLKEVRLNTNIVKSTNKSGKAIEKNILTQEMLNKKNTRYVILCDYDLNDTEITIPKGCVLDFQGGTISNGTIIGNSTKIQAKLTKIFNTDVIIKGDWDILSSYPEWFGAIPLTKDCTTEIQALFNSSFKYFEFTNSFIFKDIKINQSNIYVIGNHIKQYGNFIIGNINYALTNVSIINLYLINKDLSKNINLICIYCHNFLKNY